MPVTPYRKAGRPHFKVSISMGRLYFLSDRYYHDFPDRNLMQNRPAVDGAPHNRPYFLAFQDTKHPSIYWAVPISSKYLKYQEIAQRNIKRYGRCITICFGWVQGKKKAFLIQNMCPATAEYMAEYTDRERKPVEVSDRVAAEVEKNARDALALAKEGRKIVFPDIFKIYQAIERGL